MKALVKSKREPGLWLEEVPVPEVESMTSSSRLTKRRSAARTFTSITGRVGPENHSRPHARGSRVCGQDR